MAITTPIAAWNFNGDGNDEVGSSNFTINGATLTPADPAWGYEGGDGDYLNASDSSTLDIGTGDFSIVCYVKPDSSQPTASAPSTEPQLLNKYDGATGYATAIVASTGRARAFIKAGGTRVNLDGTTDITDDDWHHIVATFDRDGNGVLYVDGSAEATSSIAGAAGDVGNALDLVFGKSAGGSYQYFGGVVSFAALFNVALSSAEVTEMYNSGTPKIYTSSNGWIDNSSLEYNSLLYYKMESTTDEVAGQSLSVSGATSGVSGIINNAYSYSGTDVMYLPSFACSNTSYSISMWAQSDVSQTNGDYNLLFRWTTSGTDNARCYWSGYSNNNMRFRVVTDAGNNDLIYAANIGTGMHHYVFVVDDAGGNMYIYLDGSQVASTALSGTPTIGARSLDWGNRQYSANEGWDGVIDEVLFINKALSASEVSTLYASGSPGSGQQYPFAGGVTYLISTIMGVDPANISTINGVSIANISKWNGTSIQ